MQIMNSVYSNAINKTNFHIILPLHVFDYIYRIFDDAVVSDARHYMLSFDSKMYIG